jgi:N-acetylmuramoyl-L-alanine amidase
VSLLQRALRVYGYRIEESGDLDTQTRFVLRAFQAHFRPSNWSGHPDAETAAIAFALIEKYRPRALEALLGERQPTTAPD